MSIRLCPNCGFQEARQLEAITKWAHITYYNCPVCRHSWTLNKDVVGKGTYVARPKSE